MFDWNTTRIEALLADINVTLNRLVDLWDEPKVQPAPEPVPEPEPAPVVLPNFVLPKTTRFIDAFDDVDTAALLVSKSRGISFEDVLLKYLASSKESNTFSTQSLVKKFRYLTGREVAATLYALRAENKIRARKGLRYGEERVLFGLPASVLAKDRISLGLVRRMLTEQFPSDAR